MASLKVQVASEPQSLSQLLSEPGTGLIGGEVMAYIADIRFFHPGGIRAFSASSGPPFPQRRPACAPLSRLAIDPMQEQKD